MTTERMKTVCLALALVTACACSEPDGSTDGGGADGSSTADAVGATTPTVLSTTPVNSAIDVPLNGIVSATFSEAMDSATLTSDTFTLTSGPAAVPVEGTVLYFNSTAVFWSAALLGNNSTFTATITTGAKSATGIPLGGDAHWTFATGDTVASELPVNLRTAGDYVILAKAAITTVPISAITGDLGVSPAAAGAITGFTLTADSTNVFSTSVQVTGRVYAANYAPPTPSNLTTAVIDMELAFADALGRAPDVTELGAGNIGGMTLAPGVYSWSTGLLIPLDVTLVGSATDVWIFQIAQGVDMTAAMSIFLAGGARSKNVFWQVSGPVTLGALAHFEGIVLTQTAVTLGTGASVTGRLLAQTAVTLDGNTIVEPAP